MANLNVLLVEGRDDEAVIRALLEFHGITNVTIKEKGGKNNILDKDSLMTQLLASDLSVLGIVLDADDNLEGRWQSLRTILATSHYGYTLPQKPEPTGTILKFTNPNGVPVGIWLMPNNQTSGTLEDFAAQLVPDGDPLWTYAATVLDNLPEQRFKEKDRSKAHIHTWLAWQEDPREPIGLAIKKKYLLASNPAANEFIDWINRLFTGYVFE